LYDVCFARGCSCPLTVSFATECRASACMMVALMLCRCHGVRSDGGCSFDQQLLRLPVHSKGVCTPIHLKCQGGGTCGASFYPFCRLRRADGPLSRMFVFFPGFCEFAVGPGVVARDLLCFVNPDCVPRSVDEEVSINIIRPWCG